MTSLTVGGLRGHASDDGPTVWPPVSGANWPTGRFCGLGLVPMATLAPRPGGGRRVQTQPFVFRVDLVFCKSATARTLITRARATRVLPSGPLRASSRESWPCKRPAIAGLRTEADAGTRTPDPIITSKRQDLRSLAPVARDAAKPQGSRALEGLGVCGCSRALCCHSIATFPLSRCSARPPGGV